MGLRLLVIQRWAFARTIRSTSFATPQPKFEPTSPQLAQEIQQCYSKLDLSFENTKEVFKSKSNSDILRALLVLRILAVESVVRHNQRILATLRATLGLSLFKKLLKRTFFGHFVAGEDRKEVESVAARLEQFGVKSILDYSVETDLSSEEAVKTTQISQLAAEVAPAAFTSTVDAETLQQTRQKYTVHKEFADRRKDVVSARTYLYEGEHVCDRNRDIFIETVDAVATAIKGEGFVAIKLTALGRPTLLLKLSESIAQTHNFFKALTGTQKIQFSRLSEEDLIKKLKEFGVKAESQVIRDWFKTVDFDGDGYVDFHGWSKILDDHVKLGSMFKILNIKTGQLEPLIQNLTAKEEQEFSNMMRRLIDIAEHAIARGVRVMVDAEQTYFQPAISRIVLEMMRRYNHQHGNIFNTYQAYLRNTLDVMECDMQLARREGWHFGLKLVRGAYMEQERKRAASVGYPDPINPDYESTSRMYHACLERIAEEHARRGKGAVSVMIATHNEDTVRFAVNLMRDRAIAPSEKIMCFAQLYAMCDQV
ncbi:hypothetical protein Angca_004814, partial [Angiostrongylus cantonensis]